MLTGSRQSINITSNPPGADVYIMGHNRGKTPLRVKVYKQKPPLSVVVKKDGYKTEEMYSKKRFNPAYLLNLPLVGFIYPLIIDRIFYLKKNYNFTLNKGKDEYYTTKEISLDKVTGDYLIKCTGEILPCIINSYNRRKTVYLDKDKKEITIESFEISILKFGDKLFELGPNISSHKGKDEARKDNPYDIKILLENGAIKAYGPKAKIYLNTDKNGQRSVSYIVAEGTTQSDVDNSIGVVKVDGNFYNTTNYNITNTIIPYLKKNPSFKEKNSGDEITRSNLREKIQLYNSCF